MIISHFWPFFSPWIRIRIRIQKTPESGSGSETLLFWKPVYLKKFKFFKKYLYLFNLLDLFFVSRVCWYSCLLVPAHLRWDGEKDQQAEQATLLQVPRQQDETLEQDEQVGPTTELDKLTQVQVPFQWCSLELQWFHRGRIYPTVYRREGKGRSCFLEDRIASIPCRDTYFVPGRFEE